MAPQSARFTAGFEAYAARYGLPALGIPPKNDHSAKTDGSAGGDDPQKPSGAGQDENSGRNAESADATPGQKKDGPKETDRAEDSQNAATVESQAVPKDVAGVEDAPKAGPVNAGSAKVQPVHTGLAKSGPAKTGPVTPGQGDQVVKQSDSEVAPSAPGDIRSNKNLRKSTVCMPSRNQH